MLRTSEGYNITYTNKGGGIIEYEASGGGSQIPVTVPVGSKQNEKK